MRAGALALALVLGPLASRAAPSTAEVVEEARVRLEVLPALVARAEVARRKEAAALDFFAGRATLPQAFPEWAGAPWTARGWLAGELLALDRRGEARAHERLEPARGQVGEERALREEALQAEERADALRRRLLLAIRAGLTRAPGLEAGELEALRAAWSARAAEDPGEDPARAEQARQAGVALAELERTVELAVRAMAVPGDNALAERVAAWLEEEDGAAEPERGEILGRVAPLLPAELAERAAQRATERPPVAEPEPEAGPATPPDAAPAPEETVEDPARRAEVEADARKAAALRELAERGAALRAAAAAAAAREAAAAARLRELEERLRRAEAETRAARALSPLAAGREARLDAAHREHRALVAALREEVGARQRRLLEARAERRRLEAAPAAAATDDEEVAVARQRQEEAERAFAEGQIRLAQAEQVAGLVLLAEAKEARRVSRATASAKAREEVLATFLPELWTEVREAPLVLGAALRATAQTLAGLPRQLLDLRVLFGFASRSVELLLLLLGWTLVRRRGEALAEALLGSLRHLRGRDDARVQPLGLWSEDLRALAPSLHRVLRGLADLALGARLIAFLREDLALLGLPVLVWTMSRLWALPGPALRLVLALPHEARPALRVVSPEALRLAERSLQSLLGALRLFAILHFLTLDLFDADRASQLVELGREIALVVLVAGLLRAWAPRVSGELAARGEARGWLRTLERWPSTGLLAVPKAAIGLLVLAGWGLSELLVRWGEGQPGLGWLTSALARRRLRGGEAERVLRPLEAAEQARLERPTLPPPRAEELAKLRQAMLDWNANRLPGLIAVIGEPGSGKSELLTQAEAICAELLPALPRRRLRLAARQCQPEALLDWLAGALELHVEPAADPVAAHARAIEALPPGVYLIDDLHHGLLRTVGGFAGLQKLLRVLHATSEEHLWICTFHRPAWSFLAGVRSSVNLEVFRLRVELTALSGRALGEWGRAQAEALGERLDFRALAGRRRVGGAIEAAAQQAEAAWWRLLAEASQGVPGIAWVIAVASFRRGGDGEGLVVQMFSCPQSDALEDLTDFDLFVLAAVVIHDELDVAALALVLNATEGQVQESCRQLEGMGVLRPGAGGQWAVPLPWWPAVRGILRQKHFLSTRR